MLEAILVGIIDAVLLRKTMQFCSGVDTAANATSIGCLSSRTASPGRPPRLWPQLPVETRRQLAQHVGQLVQRLRRRSARSEESHLAEHDVVDR